MRSILLPIVLALLLSYLLRPIVRGAAKVKIPLPVGAAISLIGLLALVGYGISALAAPGGRMAPATAAGLTQLQQKLHAGEKIGVESDPGDPRKSRSWRGRLLKARP